MRKSIAALAAVTLSLALLPALRHNATGAERPLIGHVHAGYQPEDDHKVFIVVVGSDARHGNPLRGALADAIHIVGVNTRTMKAGILNFPRDSYVDVPGHGRNKINSALYFGGPKLLAQTLEDITGIKIDYWVLTGFQGFQSILKSLRGVKVHIPFRLYDPGGSGADIPPGYRHLSPPSALAFVRDRHDFVQGDVARTTNQAKVLIALLKKLHGEVRRNPAALLRWLAVGTRFTARGVSARELYRLGILATQLAAGGVQSRTVPVTVGTVGAASVVFISPGAQSLYSRFRKHAAL
ncbi:MAG TPA: LCP family protein [Actinomycetota bacterium]|nr:LCP family protein [Actinomycetota bacterium]